MKFPFKELLVSSVNKDQPSRGGVGGKCKQFDARWSMSH